MTRLREITRNIVVQVHETNGYNQSATAKELGISRGTLRTLLKEFSGSEGRGLNKAVVAKARLGA